MFRKAFIFLLILIPWQMALNLGEGMDLSLGRALTALLFLAWLLWALWKRNTLLGLNLSFLLWISFFFFMAFSAFFSENLEWSFRKIVFLASFLPLGLLADFFLASYPSGREKVLKAVFFSSFGVAVVGALQFFSQFILGAQAVFDFWAGNVAPFFLGRAFSEAVVANPSWLVDISGKTWLRAISVFPDPHMLSFFLNLSLGAGIALLVEKPKKIIFWIMFLGILLTNGLTFSRGGYLGLLSATFFLLVWGFSRQKAVFRILFLSLAVSGIFLIGTISPIRERLASSFDLREGSNLGRIETWKKAWDEGREHVLTGVGIGNYPLYVKPVADYREPIYAHNVYLDILLDGGISALLFWLAVLTLSASRSFLYLRKEPWRAGIVFGLIAFSVHGFFDTPLYSVSVFPLFIVFISLANYVSRADKK